MTSRESPNSEFIVSVIIVNYNGGNDIVACLHSLENSESAQNLDIIVVDNGSTDDSVAQIRTQYPRVNLHLMGENLGFAAACNVGIRAALAETILLLNPDTEVKSDAILKMYEALSRNPHWGIVGARMLNQTGNAYRAARRFPQPKDMAYAAMGLAKLFHNSRKYNGYLYGECELASLDHVDQVEGSCLMISATARAKVGSLDERFFIFFEEVDWCKRVKEAGFEIHLVNEAEVIHKVSTTMGRYFEFTRVVHAQSAMKYFRKHHGNSGYDAIRKAMTRALCLRAILLAIPAMLGLGGARKRWAGTLTERRAYKVGIE